MKKAFYVISLLFTITALAVSGCANSDAIIKNSPKLQPAYVSEENAIFYKFALGLDETQTKGIYDIMNNRYMAIKKIRDEFSNKSSPQFDKDIAVQEKESWLKTASEISNILNEEQQVKFLTIDKKHRNYHARTAVFLVKLVLTEKQAQSIEEIVKDMPEQPAGGRPDSGGPGNPGGPGGGEGRPQGTPPDRGNPPDRGGASDRQNPWEKMEEIDEKIESILLPEQLKLYKQLKTARGEGSQQGPGGRGPGSGPGGPGGGGGMPPDRF